MITYAVRYTGPLGISGVLARGVKEEKQGMERSIVGTAVKAVRHPGKVRASFRNPGQDVVSRSRRALTRKVFVGASSEYRSESDTGHYVALAQAAVKDYKVFTRFRRHPDYMVVLEHVTQQEGQAYLDILSKDAPDFLDRRISSPMIWSGRRGPRTCASCSVPNPGATSRR